MGNPLKGEATYVLPGDEPGSDGPTLTLVFDFDALMQLEDEADMSVNEIGRALGNPRLKLLRAMLWAALRKHHAEYTPKACQELLQSGGSELGAAIAKAYIATFPKPKAGAAEGDANPPEAAT